MDAIQPPAQLADAWCDASPFPLSDADCGALVRGQWVRWPGTVEQLLDLPGRYEMIGGWIILKR